MREMAAPWPQFSYGLAILQTIRLQIAYPSWL